MVPGAGAIGALTGRNLTLRRERYPSAVPANRDAEPTGGHVPPKLTLWERIKYTLVRPETEPSDAAPAEERTTEQLEEHLRRADDRERAVGLIAAPVSAIISFAVIHALIDRDHTPGAKVVASVSTLNELLLVLLALSVLMIVTALWRKRLFLGVVLAIYGVSLFQLGWLGFAIPFVLAGAWYIVRQFRIQQALRKATGNPPAPPRAKGQSQSSTAPRPRPNKRYTPPH